MRSLIPGGRRIQGHLTGNSILGPGCGGLLGQVVAFSEWSPWQVLLYARFTYTMMLHVGDESDDL